MLTLTENAREVVRKIPNQPYLSPTAGLRIARKGAVPDGALFVAAETQPHDGDEVVTDSGARVFLDKYALPALAGKILDARLDRTGRLQFSLVRQA